MSDIDSQADPEEAPIEQSEGDYDDYDDDEDVVSERPPTETAGSEEYYDDDDNDDSDHSLRDKSSGGNEFTSSTNAKASHVAFIDKYDDDGGASQNRGSDESESTFTPVPHDYIKVSRLYSYAAKEDFAGEGGSDRSSAGSEEVDKDELRRIAMEQEFESEVIMESVLRWAEPYEMGVLRCESHGKQKVDEISKLLSIYADDDYDDDVWTPQSQSQRNEPINLDKTTPFSYLVATGMIPVLKKLIHLMAEKRPRCPFMNTDQCAALYMGYFLKTLNMNCPYERRQKYRTAMFNLTTIKSNTDTLLTELQDYYGSPLDSLPEGLKKKFEDFLSLENLPIEEIVLVPRIPGEDLGYDAVPEPFTDHQITRRMVGMLDQLKMVDLIHKWGAFEIYSYKKKAAQDAAERAAYSAIEAEDFTEKVNKKKQMKKDAKTKKSGFSMDVRHQI